MGEAGFDDAPRGGAAGQNMSGDNRRRSVLVLHDQRAGPTQYVREHVASFCRHSRHTAYYAPANVDIDIAWDAFDAVVIHFSVRLAYEGTLSPSVFENVKTFQGVKLALIQDEYDRPHLTSAAIRQLKIGGVFTTTPPEYRHRFYPPELTGPVEFHRCLTGYVPATLAGLPRRPIAERRIPIGYRGRVLPYWLGLLAREKYEIGFRVAEICHGRSIPHDIAWTEECRIYGPNWYNFLRDCRSTLGTESGANIIDWDGSLHAAVEAALAENPGSTFEQIYSRFLAQHEGVVCMNQVAPKVFEAIALGTPLILYEGHHSGVVEAGKHYIPLKKDLSNIDDVLATITDDALLQRMADRAHADIVASGRYSYQCFVTQLDEVIDKLAATAPSRQTSVGSRGDCEQAEVMASYLKDSGVASLPLHRRLPSREPYWTEPWPDLENEYVKVDRLIAELDRVGTERNRAIDEIRMLRERISPMRKYSPSRMLARLRALIQQR